MEPLWMMWQMPGFHSENGAKGAMDGDPQCKSELNHSICPFGGHFEAQLWNSTKKRKQKKAWVLEITWCKFQGLKRRLKYSVLLPDCTLRLCVETSRRRAERFKDDSHLRVKPVDSVSQYSSWGCQSSYAGSRAMHRGVEPQRRA